MSLHITDFRGPNSIQVDYQLTRRPYVPKLTGQQVFAVYEPLILGQMTTFLIADVTDHKLCLRTPGSSDQIEISADEVVVREAAHAELRAVRLHTGTLDIDALAGRVTVNGRGKSATLRRVGDRIQVEFGKQIADSDEITIWMPELKIPDMRLHWKTARSLAGPRAGKPADERHKRDEAGKPLYAELAAKHGFSLPPGQAIKRILVPSPERATSIGASRVRASFITWRPTAAAARGPSFIGGTAKCFTKALAPIPTTLSCWASARRFAGSDPSRSVDPKISSSIRCPATGSFRISQSQTKFAAQLEPILRKEMKLPIHLEFREVPREVYVARHLVHDAPLAGHASAAGPSKSMARPRNFGTLRRRRWPGRFHSSSEASAIGSMHPSLAMLWSPCGFVAAARPGPHFRTADDRGGETRSSRPAARAPQHRVQTR